MFDLWAGLGRARRAHAAELLDCAWGSEERWRDQLSKLPGLGRRPGGRGFPFPRSGLVAPGPWLSHAWLVSARKEQGPGAQLPLPGPPQTRELVAPGGAQPPAERPLNMARNTGFRRVRAVSRGREPREAARSPPHHTSSHLGSKDRSPSTGSPRLLGPRLPPGPSSEGQDPIQHCSKAHRPPAPLGERADSPRAVPLRQDTVLAA